MERKSKNDARPVTRKHIFHQRTPANAEDIQSLFPMRDLGSRVAFAWRARERRDPVPVP